MDGLDELMKDLAKSSVTVRSKNYPDKKSPQQHSTSSMTCTKPLTQSQKNCQDMDRQMEHLMHELSTFMIDLADPEIRSRINIKLSKIKYTNFLDYYLQNAKLSHYSVETELNRMDFRVRYNGQDTTDKDEIGDIFYATRLDDIWRFANQSIYADLYTGLEEIKRGQTYISIVATSSQFIVDVNARTFVAESVFDVVVMCEGASRGRLKLATIDGRVELSLKEKYIRQFIEPPAISVVFDDDLRQAASSILHITSADANPMSTYASSRLAPAVSHAASTILDIVAPPPARNKQHTSAGQVSTHRTTPTTSGTPLSSSPTTPSRVSCPEDSLTEAQGSLQSLNPNSILTEAATCSAHRATHDTRSLDNIASSSIASDVNSGCQGGGSSQSIGMLTESLVENVVGSLGRWLGAGQSAATPDSSLSELRRTLQEQRSQEGVVAEVTLLPRADHQGCRGNGDCHEAGRISPSPSTPAPGAMLVDTDDSCVSIGKSCVADGVELGEGMGRDENSCCVDTHGAIVDSSRVRVCSPSVYNGTTTVGNDDWDDDW